MTRERKTNMTFAVHLLALRQRSNMSQSELARRIGCRVGHVSHLENGRRLPSYELMQRMLEVFGCPAEELLSATTNEARYQIVCPRCSGRGMVWSTEA
jgi:transcriptional regulator with XRE-family HTH domain